MACGVECIFKVKVYPNKLGVLFHGLSKGGASVLCELRESLKQC